MQRILQEIIKKKNTWNIRLLVDETIVPSTQRIILMIVRFQKCLAAESVKKFRVGSVSQPDLFRGRKCRGASRIIVWKYTFNVARLICTKYLNTKLFNEIFRVSLFHMQNAKIAVYSNFQERFFQCFKLLLLKSMWQFLYFYIANRNMGRHYY